MANAGPHTNTCQFFVTFGPAEELDDKHSVFGQLVGGNDVLNKMERVATGGHGRGSRNRPTVDIVIKKTSVYKSPYDEEVITPEEAEEKKKEEEKAKQAIEDQAEFGKWFSAPQPGTLQANSTGIGKYMPAAKKKKRKKGRKRGVKDLELPGLSQSAPSNAEGLSHLLGPSSQAYRSKKHKKIMRRTTGANQFDFSGW